MASAVETAIRKVVGKGLTTLASINRRRLKAPVATIHLPHRIPPGFQGNGWMIDEGQAAIYRCIR
ncbi:MAG: carotenoid oxygenase family protein [Sphingopyxis sp.]|nr:carotenoid oxygenase family protein [Sphingopyxis sp.]